MTSFAPAEKLVRSPELKTPGVMAPCAGLRPVQLVIGVAVVLLENVAGGSSIPSAETTFCINQMVQVPALR